MRVNERMKKVFSILLCLCMVLQYVPTTAFAVTTAESGLCEHHAEHTAECGYAEAVAGSDCTHSHDELCGYAEAVAGADCTHVHDDACGYAEAVEALECHYECAECAAAAASEEPSEESSDPAPVCDCGTDDPAIHATTCAVYVAPENPVCSCAEACGVETQNFWCDVCGFDYSKCTGTDTAVQYDGGAIDLSTLTETYLISDSGEYTFIGSGNYGIKVESGNPTIVLNNASITVGEGSAIDVASGSNATIFVLGDNTIGTTKTEYSDVPCGGIFVAEGGTVNITSNGTDNILRAHGTLAAAIGGKYIHGSESYNAGSISISNVTVYAYTNNNYAAAIGAAGRGSCGTINITNAVVYAYGAGDRWTSAPGIGSACDHVGWAETIPVVTISGSEIHTFRYNPYSDYIGYLGDEMGEEGGYHATGSINCGEGGSVKSSTIYCYTGLDATTTDKVVKYGALGGLLKEDGTCEGEHSGGTQTCMGYKCANCGNWFGEKNDTHDWSNKDGICANGCELTCDHESYTEGVCDVCDYACTHTTEKDENKATCKHGDICDLCGTEYGNQDADNHTGTLGTPVPAEDGKHTATWSCCEATVTEEHTFENGKCTVCGAACTHSSFADGKCTACGIPVCSCTVKCGETVNTECTVCTAEGADLSAVCNGAEEPPVVATNNIDAAAMTPEELKAAVDAALAAGYTAITVNLAEDADAAMFSAITAALATTVDPSLDHYELVMNYSGTIDLTISGAKTVPECTFYVDEYVNENWRAGAALRSVTLTDATTIGESAFFSCAMTSFSAPNVIEIEGFALEGCMKLTDVYLPSVQTLGDAVFSDCYALKTISLPECIDLGNGVFNSCEALETVYAPKATNLGAIEFMLCTSLMKVTLGSVVSVNQIYESIDNGLFCLANDTKNIELILACDQKVLSFDSSTKYWTATEEAFDFGNTNDFMGYTFKSITMAHTPEADDGDCTTPILCSTCGEIAEEGKESHTTTEESNKATCTTKAVCDLCGTEYGEKDANNHTGTLGTPVPTEDDTQHIATWSCCEATVSEEHTLLTYSASGNVITGSCSKCPAVGTATITAGDTTYNGTAQETATVAYSAGWKGGELTVSYVNNVNAGTATASITIGEATASVEFTIAKAEIDGSTLINPEFAKGLVYNGTAQALVTKIGSVDGGYIVYSLSIDGEYTTTIPVATEAGTYRVYWTIECDENHYVDGTPGSSRVTIAAKAITVTADAVSKTYGDTDPTLTYKVEGLVNGDELTGELKRVAGENVGSYAIEQNTLTAGNNYSITYTGANLTINAKAITEADVELNGSLTYTGEEQTQPITVTEGITYEVSGNKATNVGTYELTVKGTGNYTGEVKLNWSIKEAAAVVGKAPTAKELTYTGTAQALVNAGTTADGKLVYSLSENGEFTESIPTGTNAGEYTVWYYVQGDANHSDTAKASVKVTIAKADPVIGTVGCDMALFDSTAASAVELTRTDMSVEGTLVLTDSELTAGEGTYNWKFTPKDTNNYNTITGTVVLNVTADVLEKIEASGTLEKDSYSYGDTFSIDGLTVTATYTTGATKDVTELVSFDNTLAVGQTSVKLTYQGKTCTVTGFTVAKKQLIISGMAWDIPENAVYNGTEYTATLNGTLPTGVVVTLSGDKATNAGNYTAKAVFSLAEGYSADNYEIVNGEDLTADWTIAKKNIVGAQITLGTALTYNGKQQTQAVASVKIDGLTVSYTVSGNTGTDAKDYTLTITGNGNFEGTETKEWSIAKKNISGATITLGDSLTYIGNEQTQEVADVKIGDLTVTYDVTANKQTNAGNYTLTVTGNGNFEGSVTADWSIAKAKLTITANNNSITYGDVPAANGVTGTGFVSSESIEDLSGELTYSYNYEQFGNVGTYKITPSGVTSNNYEITFADGTLTVDAKPITVTADAVSKTYGEADPALTYKVEGLVNGDELTGELKRVAGENVGDYAIEQNTLTAGDNYTITYTGANLTINAKAITATDVKLNGSLTYNGREQIQPIAVTEGITYGVSGNKATNAGAYELTVKGTGNYTGSVTLDWTIAKAKLTITADSKVIYIGEKLPTLTYTASGLVGGDKLTKEPVLTTNADADQAGSYTITAANADAGDNYTITYVSGSLTIMDKETEVETKIEQTELTEVPEGLKDTQFDTVEEIKEELISKILATSTGYSAENMVHYDVALHFSLDGGDSWILATEENFPTEGITVILPYPEGTNARDYEFVVSHMFTVTSQRLGTVAGEVEMPKVEETANGIRVTLNGLSPVTVAARYHDHTGGTATCTDKAICSICGTAYGELDASNHAGGTEVKNAKEATCGAEGYTGDTHCTGCSELVTKGTTIQATGEHTYGEWKVVKEATKTAKGEKQRTCSICGHVDSEEIPILSDIPATGDDSNIMLWGGTMVISLAALVVLLVESKKRRTAK